MNQSFILCPMTIACCLQYCIHSPVLHVGRASHGPNSMHVGGILTSRQVCSCDVFGLVEFVHMLVVYALWLCCVLQMYQTSTIITAVIFRGCCGTRRIHEFEALPRIHLFRCKLPLIWFIYFLILSQKNVHLLSFSSITE